MDAQNQKTIKNQLELNKQKTKIRGHNIMDTARFFEDTRHMIIFDVLEDKCPAGFKGERIRYYLTEESYQQAIESENRNEVKIRRHYHVKKGNLIYAGPALTTQEIR